MRAISAASFAARLGWRDHDVRGVVERLHPERTISCIQHFLYVETGNGGATVEIAALDA